MLANVSRPTFRRRGAAVCATVVAAGALSGSEGIVSAQTTPTLLVTTPYPSIEAQPGSDVKLSLAVVSDTPDVVDLQVNGMPDGWVATLRGGGFVIHEITSKP